jgi:hypothetical protein
VYLRSERRPGSLHRSAVKDRVVAHQELRGAGVAGIAVVDGVALARERAEAVSLGEIAVEIGPVALAFRAVTNGRFSRTAGCSPTSLRA